ncbi:MAG: hypothetical protein IJ572_05045 [Bacilli bacterium]|nr:hypothetical protein [Bacilli bacterium]
MKLLTHLNYFIKLTILLVVILLIVGTSNGSQFKVKNSNLNLSTDLTLMALKVEESIQNDIFAAKETYTGDLTGYGADCPLCGGHLACKSSLDVLHGNVNYDDETYGNVRIVASSKNLPCGTIIRFESKRISDEPVIAIVLDRGVRGYAIDLLAVNEEYAGKYIGRSQITYDVLRRGW